MDDLRTRLASDNGRLTAAALTGTIDPDQRLAYRFGRPSYFSFRTADRGGDPRVQPGLLERLADARRPRRMRAIEGLADVKSSTEGGNPELQIRFDRDRLATSGYTVNEVARSIRTKVQGDIATDITRDDRTIDIRIAGR